MSWQGEEKEEQNQTHTHKKSPSQWLKEEYEKAKRERKNKSSIWAVPHARPSNIVPPYWDSDGWLGGSCGGGGKRRKSWSAEEVAG